MFVKETITKTLEGGRNKRLPNNALISISPDESLKVTTVVVGARYEAGTAHHFSKKSLADLIEVLQEVHDCMGDK